MKITALLLLVLCLQVSAATKAQNVSLSEHKAPLEKVLNEIRQQTGYLFFYNQDWLKQSLPVDLEVKNLPIEKVLNLCFAGQPYNYVIINKTIVLKLIEKPVTKKKLAETPFVISGRVTDSTGTPLIGATIGITNTFQDPKGRTWINTEGNKVNAISKENGEFSMPVSVDDVLTISYIGYKPYTIVINSGMTYLTVVLYPVVRGLKEVIVHTGIQTLSKERATGSFGKPDLQVFNDRTGTTDIIGRLEGLVPGLTITAGPNGILKNVNGGNTSIQSSLIRGSSSIALNTNPLYVVNGAPVTDLASVNQDDIADITVLKDAAAAAIWGARAANGVIVITTKTGLKNQRVRISYSSYVNYQGKPDFNTVPALNSQQFIQASRQIFDPVTFPWESLSTVAVAPDELIMYNQYRGLISAGQSTKSLDSLSHINNLQQVKNIWYRNALTTNHTLSASGGNNVYSFYASLGYTDAQSNTPGQTSNTYRINLTQDVNAGQYVKISLTSQVSDLKTSSQNPISISNTFLPYQLFRDASGKSINLPYVVGYSDSLRNAYQTRSQINLDYNPINETGYAHSSTDNIQINNTANVSVKLWKGLSFQGTYNYLAAPTTSINYQDSKSLGQRQQLLQFTVAPTVGSTPVYYLPVTGGMYTSANNNQRSWTVRNQLVYSSAMRNGKDQLNVQAGQEERESVISDNSTTLLGYNEQLGTYSLIDYNALYNQGIQGTVNGGTAYYSNAPFRQNNGLTRFKSYFALASYSLNAKYALDLSWREDHSNLFGSAQSAQNKPIYSIGAKWQLGKEKFMSPLTWLNGLAIRATYGVTGNSPYVGSASTYDIVSPEPVGELAGSALSISSPANAKLFWEVTHTTNLGLDFAVLENRLTGSLDFYNKKTSNLLGNAPIDPLSGFSTLMTNLGQLQNKGIELGLNSVNIRSNKFSWTSGFTFSYNKNKLLSYLPPSPVDNIASLKASGGTYPGYPLSPVFAYQFAGLDNMGDPQIKLANGTVTKDPSAATGNDLRFMGTMTPVYNGGLTNTFSYKSISLTANMVYSGGNVMRRTVNTFYTGMIYGGGFSDNLTDPAFLNRWQKPGDEAVTNIPSYVASLSTNSSRRNTAYYTQGDINVVSASYAKIRDLTLSYNFQPGLLRMLKVQSIRIYVQATNFLIWTANHDGIDPEYISYSTGTPVLAPYAHSYSLGINVTF